MSSTRYGDAWAGRCSERRAIIQQGEAELDGLPPSPALDEAARYLAYDRLITAVDAHDLGNARRTGRPLLDTFEAAGDSDTAPVDRGPAGDGRRVVG